MVITKKLFRQLILGKLLDKVPLSQLSDKKHEEEIKRAQKISSEIIQFAEEHNLFNKDLK